MTPLSRRAALALALAGTMLAWAVVSPHPSAASAPPSPGLLAPPVSPVHALALFDPPPAPWAAGHRGIDLAAAPGGEVRAPADGVVAFAGRVVDRGVLTIDHGAGVVTSFEPVMVAVTVGTRVARGDVVATLGPEQGHCAPTPCLHWGVRVDGEYADPLDLLAGFGPVALLPLADQTKAPVRTSDSLSFFTAPE